MIDEMKHKIPEALAMILLVIFIEMGVHYLQLSAWPVFLTIIFFMMAKQDLKAIPQIFAGGVLGISLSVMLHSLTILLSEEVNDFVIKLIFVALFLFCLILFGKKYPLMLNNYAFTYFLVTGATKGQEIAKILFISLLAGGGLLIAGTVLLERVFEKKHEEVSRTAD